MKLFEEKPEIKDILFSFVPTIAIFLINKLNIGSNLNLITYLLFQLFIILAVNSAAFLILRSKLSLPVYWRSNLIANVMLIGILISTTITQDSYYNSVKPFGNYLIALSFFHLSEYLITLIANYKSLNLKSFLLNHSLEYNLAALISWIEFLIEVYFFPQMKTFWFMWIIGLTMIIFGEIVRKLAMYTAGTSFNHLVQSKKANDHVLITHGVYSFARHPSYLGWFCWSVGTQILLSNPICIILYIYASWTFFSSRIVAEEYYLARFFGDEYIRYAKRVPIRIPFIKGHVEYGTGKLSD